MNTKKCRNSNMELLRICEMLMIIIFHMVRHCVNIQLTDGNSIARWGNGLFNYPAFYKKLLILVSIMPLGIIANAIFILISGYFMSNKIRMNIVGTARKLLSQLVSATVLLVIVSMLVRSCVKIHEAEANIKALDVQIFNGYYWFVGYYFSVILTAALFLNKLLQKINEKQYLTFLTICFVVIQLGWLGSLIDNFAVGLRTLLAGIFLYSFGGYIQKYNPFKRLRFSSLCLIILVVYILIYISNYNITMNNIEQYLYYGSNGEFYQVLPSFENYSIIVIIMGITLFEMFKRIRIPQSTIINYLGSSTFMVYLIHDNDFFYSLWNTQDWITLLYYRPYAFIFKILIWTLITFMIGVTAYILYTYVLKIFTKYKYLFLKSS